MRGVNSFYLWYYKKKRFVLLKKNIEYLFVALWGHNDKPKQTSKRQHVLITYTPFSKVWRVFFCFLIFACIGKKTPSGATQSK